MKESILDYNLNSLEKAALNPYSLNKEAYLKITAEEKRLSDLHLLFVMRRQSENCSRIMEESRKLMDKAET